MTSAAPPTVFVIDDDASVRAAIHGMLKSVGLRCETFGTPQEFLQGKQPDGPSCLVLDVRLPGVSGLDFQHELAEAGVRIPIIFITGHELPNCEGATSCSPPASARSWDW